ncbi:MAG: hypothetical protein WBQ79_07085 [Acidobacteriaceae bacterium]
MMYRWIAAGVMLLPVMAAFPTQKPPTRTAASVKLWLDTNAASPCEQATPASGAWMIRNNEGRDVVVTVHRIMARPGVTKEDQMRDTLGPGESRDLGCEISEEGHQTLTLVKAVY